MEEIKIGDDVLVKGKIIEIRFTAKGKVFRVEIKNKIAYHDSITSDEMNIVHINKG